MKICIPLMSLSESGGVKVLFKLADFLVDWGYDVTILTFRETSHKKLNFSTKAKIRYITVNNIIKKILLYPLPLVKDFILMFYLFKNMPNCDIAISNYFLTTYPVWLSPRPKLKLYYCQAFEPMFFDEYSEAGSSELSKLIKRVYRLLAKYSYRLGLYMFANNKTIVQHIKQEIKKELNIPILPAGVDTTIFYPNPKIKKKVNHLTIGIIASPIYWKGTKYFLEAISILRERNNVNVVCAFGPLPKGSPNMTSITWVNPRTQKELAEFYNSVDILVSPMLIYNEFPLPPLEAMACGSVVMSTPLLYAKHRVHYYEISPRDSNDIVKGIKELIENPALRKKLSIKGYQLSQKFDWQVIEKTFKEVLIQLGQV